MKSNSINLCRALVIVVMQVTLLSLFASRAHGSPLASPTDTANGDGLLHHITRSRYCGRKLTETLAMLCQGRYPMMGHHRSEYLSDQPQPQVEVEVATLPDSGSAISRPKAPRRVRRAGIYDECCKKSCSYAELRSYCEWCRPQLLGLDAVVSPQQHEASPPHGVGPVLFGCGSNRRQACERTVTVTVADRRVSLVWKRSRRHTFCSGWRVAWVSQALLHPLGWATTNTTLVFDFYKISFIFFPTKR